jgi:hypothetical protein
MITRKRKRSLRPVFDDLEGRPLLSLVGTGLAETSFSAPAVTTFNYALYMAWRRTDNRVNIENLATQAHTTLVDTTSADPALATFNGRLVVAWTGTDGQHHLNVQSSSDGTHFDVTTRNTLPQTTFASDGPSLAAYRGFLVIAWTGTDQNLNDAYSRDGKNFGSAITFGSYDHATSQYAPALTNYGNELFVAWTGTNSRLNLFDLTETFFVKKDANEFSHNAPSLTSNGSGSALFLAYTGTNSQLYINDVTTGTTATVGQSSPYGPSLAFGNGGTRRIAWTGTDGFGPFGGDLNYEVA